MNTTKQLNNTPASPKLQQTRRARRDWGAYDASLRRRGAVTVWLAPDALASANAERSGERGRPLVHADAVVEAVLLAGAALRLPLRQSEGLAVDLLSGHGVAVPDHSTLSRRRATLDVRLPRLRRGGPVTIIVDSTGLKVSGAGEWRARRAKSYERRGWTKLHVAVDAASGEIVAHAITASNVHDCSAFPALLADAAAGRDVARVVADGAYDNGRCLRAIQDCRGSPAPVVPPQRNAVVHGRAAEQWLRLRNKRVASARELGRSEWRRLAGYGERSLVEATMWSLGAAFGGGLRARSPGGQAAEVALRVKLLNQWLAA